MSEEVMLDQREATTRLKISDDTLNRYCEQGLIRKFKINGHRNRYLESDILGLIKLQQEVK